MSETMKGSNGDTLEFIHEPSPSELFLLELEESEKQVGRVDDPIDLGKYSDNSEVSEILQGRESATRGELLDKGFAFLNRIGGGEKPILNGVIFDDELGEEVDLGRKVLLTERELEIVRNSQEHERGELALDDVRKRMAGFMLQALEQGQDRDRKKSAIFNDGLKVIFEGADEDKKRRVAEWLIPYTEGKPGLNYIIDSVSNGFDVNYVNGVPVEAWGIRRGKLAGAPSPFLDSGFRFGDNIDLTLFPNDAEKTRRLNMVVLHLLSRGIDEVGGSNNGSFDQRYVGAKEFMELDGGSGSTNDSGEIGDISAMRIMARAGIGIDSES